MFSETGSWRVRPATEADLDAMVGLLRELFAVEEDFAFDPARQRRGLAQLIGAPTEQRAVLVADAGGEVVGMATVQVVVSTAEGGAAGLVEDVVVRSDWRGRGIGRGLLQALEEWARARGVTRLQLLADSSNAPALGFYRAARWTPTRLVALRRRL